MEQRLYLDSQPNCCVSLRKIAPSQSSTVSFNDALKTRLGQHKTRRGCTQLDKTRQDRQGGGQQHIGHFP
jgi:hypothetical protein